MDIRIAGVPVEITEVKKLDGELYAKFMYTMDADIEQAGYYGITETPWMSIRAIEGSDEDVHEAVKTAFTHVFGRA